jgi:hypothetical protein
MSDIYFRKAVREMGDALSETVRLDHGEVFRLVVKDLVSKRNACRDKDLTSAFDTILRSHYLTEDEFTAAVECLDP